MALFKHPTSGHVQTAQSKPVVAFLESRGYELHTPDEPAPEPGELTGKALDAALEEAGLPKTGRADEKRARLVAHEEAIAAAAAAEAEEVARQEALLAAGGTPDPSQVTNPEQSPEGVN